MNSPSAILLGCLATVLLSLAGLILVPSWQVRDLAPVEVTDAEGAQVMYPPQPDEYAEAPGRLVYISQGCVYCHSQQVRPESFGSDIERGWGDRRSVPRDYLHQSPPLLGTMRTGPDLASIGSRQPSEAWHHLHLYDARIVSPGSIMPPFKFLYQTVHQNPGSRGYALPESFAKTPTWIVPTKDGDHLVAYLKSLRQAHALAEVQ